MRITIATDTARVEGKLAAATAAIPAALVLGTEVAAARVERIIVPAIVRRTPVRSGMLANSTASSYSPVPDGFDVTVRQPATSAKNRDGSGGGFPYVVAVIKGRKAIEAPSSGPFSTGKKALAGPGFGPVKRVKASKPNDYVTPAVSDARTDMHGALMAGAQAAGAAIVRVMR
jgi:hypothetical protein